MKTPFLSRILLALACVGLLALPAKRGNDHFRGGQPDQRLYRAQGHV